MPYDLIPGVDEDYKFPPQVIAALIESLGFSNLGAAMTTSQRNALNTADLPAGFYIYNTTIQAHEMWRPDFQEWHFSLLPPGTAIEWPGENIPTGWTKEIGQYKDRTEYSALFRVYGTKYGSTTPNNFRLRERGGRGTIDSSGSYPLGDKGGSPTSTVGLAHLPPHTHTGNTAGASVDHGHWGTTDGVGDHQHTYSQNKSETVNGTGSATVSDYDFQSEATSPAGAHAHTFVTGGQSADHTHAFETHSTGDGNPLPTMSPYISANIIVKY